MTPPTPDLDRAFKGPGDRPDDTPTTLDSDTDTPDTPSDTQSSAAGDGAGFDVEETRVRYLEKGEPADILRLVEHYTGQPAREDY